MQQVVMRSAYGSGGGAQRVRWRVVRGARPAVGVGDAPAAGLGYKRRAMATTSEPLAYVKLFTDGACRGNPGPGGWAFILQHPASGKAHEGSGGEAHTTNNRMELMAAIQGLKALKRPCRVTLRTDSRYVMDGLTKWIHGWMKNGWRTASRDPVKNADLWQELLAASKPHRVEWVWVKGHAGHPDNERADKLASDAALAM